MRRLTLAVALMLWAAMALPGITFAEEKDVKAETAAVAEPQNMVAAKVNGVDIMLDAVLRMESQVSAEMPQVSGPHGPEQGPDAEAVRKEALDRLILQELAFQRARAVGIKVDQSAVDDALKTIRENVGGEEAYKQLLANEKLSEAEIRDQEARNIAIQRIYAKEVLQNIIVPEGKMKEEYKKHKDQFLQQEKMTLVDVVLFLDLADKGSAAKAEEVLKKIRENNNDPHKLVQDGTFVVRDYEPRKDRDKELIEAARKLKPGEISGIITTSDSLHIIKLTSYVPEKQYSYDEVKPLIEQKLKNDEQNRRAMQWFDGLKKDAKIQVLVPPAGEKNGQHQK